MGGWLRHRPGGVGLRSERPGVTGPWGRRRRGTCSPARSRERTVGTQQCTQIGENGLSASFRGICVHCCDAGVARADGGGKGVYTDRRKWPLDAVLGHLCTLLRRGGRASGRGGRGSVHRSEKMASRRRFGAFVYTVASRGSRERTVGTQQCTQIGGNGLSTPFWGICVHCCDTICVHCCDARLRRVARAAPSRGRRLHRGVNPHKPRWI